MWKTKIFLEKSVPYQFDIQNLKLNISDIRNLKFLVSSIKTEFWISNLNTTYRTFVPCDVVCSDSQLHSVTSRASLLWKRMCNIIHLLDDIYYKLHHCIMKFIHELSQKNATIFMKSNNFSEFFDKNCCHPSFVKIFPEKYLGPLTMTGY